MAMWLAGSEHDTQPVARIDLTPMIGVFAALLAIALAFFPPQTRKVPVPIAPYDGPPIRYRHEPPPPVEIELALDGSMTWNGARVSPTELEQQLTLLDALEVKPEIDVHAPASLHFEYVAQVAAATSRHHLRFGFVGK
jgi:biopolymer transport protein ExbD